MSRIEIQFITPLFSRGSYEDRPEVRPSSIRGQLHWWFRALGGTIGDERALFGSVHGNAMSSKVVVRVSDIRGDVAEFAVLKHKETQGGQANPKTAFAPGTKFALHLLTRHGRLPDNLQSAFDRTVEAWLLLGALGLRSTRAAGSFKWQPIEGLRLTYPDSFEAYEDCMAAVLHDAPVRHALLTEPFSSAEAARRIVSDTLGGRNDRAGQNDLARLGDPLGRPFNGRKTSPLRFRIVEMGDQYRIAALWDGRSDVT